MAVLVPRRAIAEGLSKFVATARGSTVGEEVGIGIGGSACISPRSVIVFMTYGFFKAISTGTRVQVFATSSLRQLCNLY